MRVFWSDEERRLVVESYLQYVRNNEYTSVLNALRQAQKALPANLQRKLISMQQVPWFHDELVLAKSNKPAISAAAASTKPVEIQPDQVIDKLVEKLVPLIGSMIEEVISPIRIQEAMNLAVSKYMNSLDTKFPAAAPIAKVKKEKVVLVNLLPSQYQEIIKEYSELFDFVLWVDGEDGYTKLKSHANTAYRIFGMTDFIKHSVDKFLATNAGSRYIRFTGGVSTLKDLIEREYIAT